MIMTIIISDAVQTAARALALKQRRSGIQEAIRWRICPLASVPGEHISVISRSSIYHCYRTLECQSCLIASSGSLRNLYQQQGLHAVP